MSLHQLRTSRHALSVDIMRFVTALRPKAILPVCTFCPEEFGKRFEDVYLPRDGETIEV